MHRGFRSRTLQPSPSQRGRFPNSERRRIDMDEKERASVDPATSPFESRLTRDELLKRGAAAAVAVGVGGSLGGVARAATRTRRRFVASTPLDTLVVAVEGDIDTFDPAFTVGSKPSQTTIQNTFDQLTQYKQVTKHVNGITYAGVDTEAILPMLAQSYVRKGNDFIFTLRKGLKYHDGTPITAKEIEQGYKRIFDAKGISYFLLTMAAVTDPSHIKALDSRRVRIRMNQPNVMLEMNTKIAPFDKKEFRQAVSYAVPYDSILKDVMHGYAQRNRSIVGNGMPGSDFSFWHYDTDLKKAADLLNAAGYSGGKGAAPITITVRADWEEAERAAILIQAQLQQLGLNVSVQKLAFAPFNEQEQGRKLQVWIDEWLSWVNDPWYHMSWNVTSTSPTDYTNYNNKAVDALVKKWTLSLNQSGRLAGAREA